MVGRGVLTGLCAAVTALVVVVTSLPASAGRPEYAISRPGPSYHLGVVTSVYDGDTIHVDIDGDRSRKSVPIRILGLQAMELTRSSKKAAKLRGECHAAPATVALRRMVMGRVVRVSASNGAVLSRGRPWRYVYLYNQNRWTDVGALMVRRGMALPVAHHHNTGHNQRYFKLARFAARDQVGIYDSDACGAAPARRAKLTLSVNWKRARGQPSGPNSEFVRIRNDSPMPVGLGGWWVRNWELKRFVIPRGTVIPPRRAVMIYVGKGQNTSRTFYWGLARKMFKDVSGPPKFVQGAGYLFDHGGDLRAHHFYGRRP